MRLNKLVTAMVMIALPISATAIDPGAAFGQALGQIFQQGSSAPPKPAPAPQQHSNPQPRQAQPSQPRAKKISPESPLASAFNSKPPTTKLEIQRFLKQEGYYDGNPDGKWGDGTRIALELFAEKQDLYAELETKDGAKKVIQKIILNAKDSSSGETRKVQVATGMATTAVVVASAQATAGNTKEVQKLQANYTRPI